jgi:hypothetical protein
MLLMANQNLPLLYCDWIYGTRMMLPGIKQFIQEYGAETSLSGFP